MEKYVTGNVATNLYWLGRYLERISITLREIALAYDQVIDIDKDAGVKLYKQFDIELTYTNAYDFLNEAIFGEHNANILDTLTYVRENAIICRHLLDSEAFGEIIALHALFKETFNNRDEVDYKCMDRAQSLIGQIWNALARRKDQELSDAFFRLGRITEEADFRIRRNKNDPLILSIKKEIDAIALYLNQEEHQEQSFQAQTLDEDTLLDELNSRINYLIFE